MENLRELIAEATYHMARKRYANSPWVDARASDAALAALEAADQFKPDSERQALVQFVNFVAGMAGGMTRKAATEESEAESLCDAISDIVGDVEDPDAFLESLGWRALDADAGFVETRVGSVPLREAVEQLVLNHGASPDVVEAILAGDEDTLRERFDLTTAHLIEWAGGGYVNLVPEPEPVVNVAESPVINGIQRMPETTDSYCPIAWVKRGAQGPDGKWHIESEGYDGRFKTSVVQGSGWFQAEEVENRRWIDKTLGERDLLEEKGYSENGDFDPFLGTAMEGWPMHMVDMVERAKLQVGILKTYRPWNYIYAATIVVPNDEGEFVEVELTPLATWLYIWRRGLHLDPQWRMNDGKFVKTNFYRVLVTQGVPEGGELRGYDFGALDIIHDELRSLTRSDFARFVNAASGKEDVELRKVLWAAAQQEAVEVTAEQVLREALLQQVISGEVFPAAAARALAKLDGMLPQQANKLGDAVFSRSQQLKEIWGQKRFSSQTELLLAEREFGVFGMHLPKRLVAFVGKPTKQQMLGAIVFDGVYSPEGCAKAEGAALLMLALAKGKLDFSGVGVVCHTKEVAALAKELGIMCIEIPQSEYSNGFKWAAQQCAAVADKVVATAGFKGILEAGCKAQKLPLQVL